MSRAQTPKKKQSPLFRNQRISSFLAWHIYLYSFSHSLIKNYFTHIFAHMSIFFPEKGKSEAPEKNWNEPKKCLEQAHFISIVCYLASVCRNLIEFKAVLAIRNIFGHL